LLARVGHRLFQQRICIRVGSIADEQSAVALLGKTGTSASNREKKSTYKGRQILSRDTDGPWRSTANI
jgi:hypothetical protein